MTRYDKIYVIDKECPSYIDPIRDSDGNALMEHEGPVIVLSIKEAKELWNAAQDRANALQLGDPGDTKIFEAYMKSKGVNIEG